MYDLPKELHGFCNHKKKLQDHVPSQQIYSIFFKLIIKEKRITAQARYKIVPIMSLMLAISR